MLNDIVDSQKVRSQKAATLSQSTGGSSFVPRRSKERQEIEMLKETLRQRAEEIRQWDKDHR
jgi:membrane protein involved in colicin uptake